jgi:hypothetical protein
MSRQYASYEARSRELAPSSPGAALFTAFGLAWNSEYFGRVYEKHFVYWKMLNNGEFGIVTVLHERMHQIDRFREDFGEDMS